MMDFTALKFAVLLLTWLAVAAAASKEWYASTMPFHSASRTESLVDPAPAPSLSYHGGKLLTSPALNVNLLWYGDISQPMKSAISDFVDSFSPASSSSGTVSGWWSNSISPFHDASGSSPSATLKLGTSASVPAASKKLSRSEVSKLVTDAIAAGTLPAAAPDNLYVVLTAADVDVDDFCMNTCGFHSSSTATSTPFVWVGNAATQCPGLCAWPYAKPQYGPPTPALTPPNGDAATDGMIINLAYLFVGAVTNPFGNGYYQGDASVPMEAATACAGIYGKDSYPGYAGDLLKDPDSGASYNAVGVNERQFLLPAVWSPTTHLCQPPSV